MSGKFQNGSLTRIKNKTGPDSWMFRFRETIDGQRKHRNVLIGKADTLRTRKDAENAVLSRRERINAGIRAPETIAQLVEHYKAHELTADRKTFSTMEATRLYLQNHIVPAWGAKSLGEIRAVQVESWLDSLKRAPGTRSKIRNIFSALYTHAIRHDITQRNPITHVRASAQRQREPDVLTPTEFQALLCQLTGAARLMVFLAGATGMRRGELVALRWSDVGFLSREVYITRSCVRNRFGNTKTQGSSKPLPLHDQALRELSSWRGITAFAKDSDLIFASERMKGKQPLSPDTLLKKVVRPAVLRASIPKTVGWHTFRHSLATTLHSLGVEPKVVSELLRHANIRMTLDVYTHAVTSEKRAASDRAFDFMLGDKSTPEQAKRHTQDSSVPFCAVGIQ